MKNIHQQGTFCKNGKGVFSNYQKLWFEIFSIDFPITILGKGDKTKVHVTGGFKIEEGVQGNVHIQNMTIRQSKACGVAGKSPFTLEDVIVEQCGQFGVYAYGTACVARCTNVEVRQCKMSGVSAGEGGSITLMGPKTTVHHNNTGV